MRLRTRFRLIAAASLATVLTLALLLGWASRSSLRASGNDVLAGLLLQASFERALLRDEYLLLEEPRARQQWEAATRRLQQLLRRAAVEFDGAEDRRTIQEMSGLVRQGDDLFDAVVAGASAGGQDQELRRRVVGKLLLISHDLNARARQLAGAALARLEATLWRSSWALVALLVGVVAVTLASSRMLAESVERRVARLRDAADRLAAGDLAHRTGLRGEDELAELGGAFDQMAARLQASNDSLQGEISVRRRAEAQVTALNEDLRRGVRALEVSNRELEAFSYAVSHDLRAPLRSISGFSQAVLEDYGPKLDATGRKYLTMANDGARELGQLIDDLLALSRVARIEMTLQAVDLTALARTIVGDLRGEAPERQVEVEIAEGLVASGDPTLLRLALENLLRNAWKFTSRHPTARVKLERAAVPEGDGFQVSDDGAGFDMAYVGKLFQPFQRLHRSSEFPGTGVGLATVSRIVHRHGGSISARGAVEQGATITFTLPRRGGPHADPDHPAGRGQREGRAPDRAGLQGEQDCQ